MNLRDRIERLKELIDRPHYGDRNGPRIIRIVGGLPEPANATIDGQRIDITEGESIEAFERRAVELGYEIGADFVILVGCDAARHLPSASR
jgi:hypothetical protein